MMTFEKMPLVKEVITQLDYAYFAEHYKMVTID